MSGKKPTDDVQQLLKDLSLGDMQYREFSSPQAANLKLAGSRPQEPVVALPPDASVLPAKTGPSAELPEVPPAVAGHAPLTTPSIGATRSAAAAAPANAPTLGAAPRAVHESPLNFTFERLRRQVIPARANSPLIDLQLPPRSRVVPPSRLDQLSRRLLSDVFATLAQPPAGKRQLS